MIYWSSVHSQSRAARLWQPQGGTRERTLSQVVLQVAILTIVGKSKGCTSGVASTPVDDLKAHAGSFEWQVAKGMTEVRFQGIQQARKDMYFASCRGTSRWRITLQSDNLAIFGQNMKHTPRSSLMDIWDRYNDKNNTKPNMPPYDQSSPSSTQSLHQGSPPLSRLHWKPH